MAKYLPSNQAIETALETIADAENGGPDFHLRRLISASASFGSTRIVCLLAKVIVEEAQRDVAAAAAAKDQADRN